jgi:hypothetical protein
MKEDILKARTKRKKGQTENRTTPKITYTLT